MHGQHPDGICVEPPHTLVCILIEPSKGVDLVIANICHRGIDEASRPLSDCGDDLGHVWLMVALAI